MQPNQLKKLKYMENELSQCKKMYAELAHQNHVPKDVIIKNAMRRGISLQHKALDWGTPGRIRTPNLLIRSQTLYPIELRAQVTLSYHHIHSLYAREDSNPQPLGPEPNALSG